MYQRSGAVAYKADLSRSIALLEHIKNPQKHFRSVHIAGTNGKGSISHILAAIFQSAGYKTGLYTSPHLIDFRERIKIDGQMISKKTVSNFIRKNKDYLDKIQASFFEMSVALAFEYFSKEKVDIAIVETGMGGRLDSSNLLHPEISVISNIALDHTKFLGNSISQIASEKAGIIKHNTPVIIGEKQKESDTVFIETAANRKAELIFAEEQCKTQIISHQYIPPLLQMKVSTKNKVYSLKTSLAGTYQTKNIQCVISTIEKLQEKGYIIKKKHIRKGLEEVEQLTGFRGRWQYIKGQTDIILDTAHNQEGLEHVAKMLQKVKYKKLHIVLAMVDDKDHKKILALLAKDAIYYFCKASVPRGYNAEKLRKTANNIGLHGIAYKTVSQALKAAIKNASKDDLIFIGGSTFTVGDALKYFSLTLRNIK